MVGVFWSVACAGGSGILADSSPRIRDQKTSSDDVFMVCRGSDARATGSGCGVTSPALVR